MQESAAYRSIVAYEEYLKIFTKNRKKEKEELMKKKLKLQGDVEVEIRKQEPTMEQEQGKEVLQNEEAFHLEIDGKQGSEGKKVEVVQVLPSYDQLHGNLAVSYKEDNITYGMANEVSIAPTNEEHISLQGNHKGEGRVVPECAKPALTHQLCGGRNASNDPSYEPSIASPTLHPIGKEPICVLDNLDSDDVHTYESNTEILSK